MDDTQAKLKIAGEIVQKKQELLRFKASIRDEELRKTAAEREVTRFKQELQRIDKDIRVLEQDISQEKGAEEKKKSEHKAKEKELFTSSVQIDQEIKNLEQQVTTEKRNYEQMVVKVTQLERELNNEKKKRDMLHFKLNEVEQKLRESRLKQTGTKMRITSADRNQIYDTHSQIRLSKEQASLAAKKQEKQTLDMKMRQKEGDVQNAINSIKRLEQDQKRHEMEIKTLERKMY